MGIASTKKKLGFFLRRFFGLKKHHFPIHLPYKLRVCINRDFSSVYWLLSEKLSIILLKAHVSRTNFLSGIHFWSQNCSIYYRSQDIKQYVAQGGKMPTSVKCNPHLEPCPMNLPNFWYGSCSNGLLWENHTLYAGKNLVWRNFGPFKAKIWPFLAKIAVFECFWPITSKRRYESS